MLFIDYPVAAMSHCDDSRHTASINLESCLKNSRVIPGCRLLCLLCDTITSSTTTSTTSSTRSSSSTTTTTTTSSASSTSCTSSTSVFVNRMDFTTYLV